MHETIRVISFNRSGFNSPKLASFLIHKVYIKCLGACPRIFTMQFGQVWDAAKPDGAPLNLDMTIEELRRRDADIVLLQEVEHVEPEKGQVKPPPNYSKLRKALPQYDGFFSYPKYSETPFEKPFERAV